MNYYERHIGDYLKDTAHLSLLEHGVYARLLDVYYIREEGIPSEQVARLIGARSKDEKEALDAVLSEYFSLSDGIWHQGRCDKEIARLNDKRRKATASATARWSRSERNAGALPTHSEKHVSAPPTHVLTECEGNALQSPDSNHQTPITSRSQEAGAPVGAAPRETFDAWQFIETQIKPAYPAGVYRDNTWLMACHDVTRLVERGADCALIVQRVVEYRAQQDAMGNTGSRFILSPAKFFGESGHWRGPFPLPAVSQPRSMSTTERVAWRPDPEEERRAQARIAGGVS